MSGGKRSVKPFHMTRHKRPLSLTLKSKVSMKFHHTDAFQMHRNPAWKTTCIYDRSKVNLTHLTRMELPTLINWTSLFLFQGLVGAIFHFYPNFDSIFCKQTVVFASHKKGR